MVDVVAPVLHVQFVAPLAVKIADEPKHNVGLLTLIVGVGFIKTVEVAIPVQPNAVPITV